LIEKRAFAVKNVLHDVYDSTHFLNKSLSWQQSTCWLWEVDAGQNLAKFGW